MAFCRDPALPGTSVPSAQVFARGSAGKNRFLQLRVQCPRSRVGPRTPRDVTNRGRPQHLLEAVRQTLCCRRLGAGLRQGPLAVVSKRRPLSLVVRPLRLWGVGRSRGLVR